MCSLTSSDYDFQCDHEEGSDKGCYNDLKDKACCSRNREGVKAVGEDKEEQRERKD
jgi:hypothetical protein